MLFIASDFTSISSHIHNWVLFLVWLHLFILSGVIFLWISGSILGIYWPREFIFQCPIFLPLNTVHGVQRKEYWSGLPFASPVDQVLSELSTMTCLSWVALHSMAHSFIEPDKFQDGGLEGCVLISSCKNSKNFWSTGTPKLQLAAEQPMTGKCWIQQQKKDTPCPRAKEKPHQDGRRGEIAFRIKPHTRQRHSDGSNKSCVYQDPETPQRLS